MDEDPNTVARLGRLDRSKPFGNVISFIFLVPASVAGTDIVLHPEYDPTGESGPSMSVPVRVQLGECLVLTCNVVHHGTFGYAYGKKDPKI